jgi:hypothetical protein
VPGTVRNSSDDERTTMEAAGLERHDGPSRARVYDALRGGHQGLAADRALADDLEAACPGLRDLVAIQRRFVLKAARWTAAVKGISQFIDAGAGFPATPAVHGEVRQAEPGASVAYVDCDPEAAVVLRAAYQGLEGIAVTEGDVTDPEAVLADEGLRGVISLGEPACVVFGGLLSSLPADMASATVAGFTRRMVPGSAVIISCFSYSDPGLAARMAGTFAGAGPFFSHDAGTIEGFFGGAGLRIVHRRPMNVACWPACPLGEQEQPELQVLGGVGILG